MAKKIPIDVEVRLSTLSRMGPGGKMGGYSSLIGELETASGKSGTSAAVKKVYASYIAKIKKLIQQTEDLILASEAEKQATTAVTRIRKKQLSKLAQSLTYAKEAVLFKSDMSRVTRSASIAKQERELHATEQARITSIRGLDTASEDYIETLGAELKHLKFVREELKITAQREKELLAIRTQKQAVAARTQMAKDVKSRVQYSEMTDLDAITAAIANVEKSKQKALTSLGGAKQEKTILRYAGRVKELNRHLGVLDKRQRALEQSARAASGAMGHASNITQRFGRGTLTFLSRWRNRILLVTFAVAGLISQLKQSIEAIQKEEAALRGLTSVGEKSGESFGALKAAALTLSKDGLMTVGEAAGGLKNLLAAGFGLNEAINLMITFKDAAAFGRQGSLSFGDAIVTATEGIKNQNSILVDNVGITKNLSLILKEAGYSIQDLAKVSSDAGVRMALYNGLLKEGSLFTGDAIRLSDTLTGRFTQYGAMARKTAAILGENLKPAIISFLEVMIKMNMQIRELSENKILIEQMREWAELIGMVIEGLSRLVAGFLRLVGAFSKFGGKEIAIATGIFLLLKKIIGSGPALKTLITTLSKGIAGLSAALLATPIGIYVAALAALGAAIYLIVEARKRAATALERSLNREVEAIKAKRESIALEQEQLGNLRNLATQYGINKEKIEGLTAAMKERQQLDTLMAKYQAIAEYKAGGYAQDPATAHIVSQLELVTDLMEGLKDKPMVLAKATAKWGKEIETGITKELTEAIEQSMELAEKIRDLPELPIRTQQPYTVDLTLDSMLLAQRTLNPYTPEELERQRLLQEQKNNDKRLESLKALQDILKRLMLPPADIKKPLSETQQALNTFSNWLDKKADESLESWDKLTLGRPEGMPATFEPLFAALEKSLEAGAITKLGDEITKIYERAENASIGFGDSATKNAKKADMFQRKYNAAMAKTVERLADLKDALKGMDFAQVFTFPAEDIAKVEAQINTLTSRTVKQGEKQARKLRAIQDKLATDQELIFVKLRQKLADFNALNISDETVTRKELQRILQQYNNQMEILNIKSAEDLQNLSASTIEMLEVMHSEKFIVYQALMGSFLDSIQRAGLEMYHTLTSSGLAAANFLQRVLGSVSQTILQLIQQIAMARANAVALETFRSGKGIGALLTSGGFLGPLGIAATAALVVGMVSGGLGSLDKGGGAGAAGGTPTYATAPKAGGLRAGTAGGSISARELIYNISPSIIFSNGGDIYVGSSGVTEFGTTLAAMNVKAIQQAIETGELDLVKG